nr:MAG TPA: hypothetical protein [Caudoviricetes sp.]
MLVYRWQHPIDIHRRIKAVVHDKRQRILAVQTAFFIHQKGVLYD